jgi:hypothetical protein
MDGGDSISGGRLYFEIDSPGGDFISARGETYSGGRMYFMTPAPLHRLREQHSECIQAERIPGRSIG